MAAMRTICLVYSEKTGASKWRLLGDENTIFMDFWRRGRALLLRKGMFRVAERHVSQLGLAGIEL